MREEVRADCCSCCTLVILPEVWTGAKRALVAREQHVCGERLRLSHAVMADALKEAASEKLEGFSQDVKVRLVP